MSLLIAVIEHELQALHIAADNRATNLDGSHCGDTATKAFQIRPGIFFGISGLTDECMRLKEALDANKDLKASELITLATDFEIDNMECNGEIHGASFMLAGIHEDGEPFIWSRSTYPEDHTEDSNIKVDGFLGVDPGSLVKGCGAFKVSAPNCKTAEFVQSNFIERYKTASGNYGQAIALSIAHASEIDHTISPTMDLFSINLNTGQIYLGNYNIARSA